LIDQILTDTGVTSFQHSNQPASLSWRPEAYVLLSANIPATQRSRQHRHLTLNKILMTATFLNGKVSCCLEWTSYHSIPETRSVFHRCL